MAVFKLEEPPSRTGDNDKDLSVLFSYVGNMCSQMRYILSAIDEDNLTEDILNKMGISEKE